VPPRSVEVEHAGACLTLGRFHRWTSGRRGAFTVMLSYLGGALVLTLGAWKDPTSGWAGSCCDQEQAIWYLGWTPHAIASGLNPFFTTQIGAPAGVNLMWSPSMPLLGVLGWLPAKIGGPIFGFNVVLVVGIALSGFTAWLAIRREYRKSGGHIPLTVIKTAGCGRALPTSARPAPHAVRSGSCLTMSSVGEGENDGVVPSRAVLLS